jgi:hypothetical protein
MMINTYRFDIETVETIDKVTYGIADDKFIDVTAKIKLHLTKNRKIDNKTNINKLLTDPFPGYAKKLVFHFNNGEKTLQFNERCNRLYVENANIDSNIVTYSMCVILHLGNISMWNLLSNYLENLDKNKFDLWITIHEEHKDNVVVQTIKNKYPNVKLLFIENKGFDIGPFFFTLKKMYESNIKYDYILKLHTKSVEYHREKLLRACIGSDNVVAKTLKLFMENKEVGMISDNICFEYITQPTNTYHLKRIINKVFTDSSTSGLKVIPRQGFTFVSGTIFWIRSSIIYDVIALETLDWFIENLNDKTTFDINWMRMNNKKDIGNILWPNATGKRDCMFEHAVERFFGYMVEAKNFKIINNNNNYLSNDVVIKLK